MAAAQKLRWAPRHDETGLLLPIARLVQGAVVTRASEIKDALCVEARTKAHVSLVSSTVPAGFPSPADDYLDRPLDFNELLIANPAATFAVRVAGDSMIGAGIFPNDIAIVDRSITPVDRSVVLCLLDGDFTLKRYRRRKGVVWLQAENPAYQDTQITEDMSFEIWGVVLHSIRMLKDPK